MALMALKHYLFEKAPRSGPKSRKYVLHGLGIWNKRDHQYLQELAQLEDDLSGSHMCVLHQLNTSGIEDYDVVTTTKHRFYAQLAEDMPRLISRYDQDPEPSPDNAPSKSDIYITNPLDNFEKYCQQYADKQHWTEAEVKSSIKAVYVADSNKGTIQKKVLDSLHKYLGESDDRIWYLDSKNPEILSMLGEVEGRPRVSVLTVNREEAIWLHKQRVQQDKQRIAIYSIPHGQQPGIDLLNTIASIKRQIQDADLKISSLIVKLDSEGACLHSLASADDERETSLDTFLCQPEQPLSCPGIAAGDFFNSAYLVALLDESNLAGISDDKYVSALKEASIYAARWLAINRDYWLSCAELRNRKKSDVILPSFLEGSNDQDASCVVDWAKGFDKTDCFNLAYRLDREKTHFNYERITKDILHGKNRNKFYSQINVPRAKGVLGGYISTSLQMRERIRIFVEQLSRYCLSFGSARPLNCRIIAPSGTGKTYFVAQLAKILECRLVEVNLSQISSPHDLMQAIAQLGETNNETPMLFLDEIEAAPDFYRLLHSPLWDSSVIINGKKIAWSHRFITVVALSPGHTLDPFTDAKQLDGSDQKNNQNTIGLDAKRLQSRLNGPSINLHEDPDNAAEEELKQQIRTTRVYLLLDILIRYHPSVRLIDNRLLDIIYCSDTNKFDARSLEHYISSFPAPNDGIITLESVEPGDLRNFMVSLGYSVAPDLEMGYSDSKQANKRILDLYRSRLTELERSDKPIVNRGNCILTQPKAFIRIVDASPAKLNGNV